MRSPLVSSWEIIYNIFTLRHNNSIRHSQVLLESPAPIRRLATLIYVVRRPRADGFPGTGSQPLPLRARPHECNLGRHPRPLAHVAAAGLAESRPFDP